MKNYYKTGGDGPIFFYPPPLDITPQFAADASAVIRSDDTLVRQIWWMELNVIVSNSTITHQSTLFNTQVSLGASFWSDGPPTVPIGPWDTDNNLISRAKLDPQWMPYIANPSSGVTTGFAMKWKTPPEGIVTATNHKGKNATIMPLVEYAFEVRDPTSVLYSPDPNRVIQGWFHSMQIWATDGPVP